MGFCPLSVTDRRSGCPPPPPMKSPSIWSLPCLLGELGVSGVGGPGIHMLKDSLGNNGDSTTLRNTVIGHQVEINHQSISEHRLGMAVGPFVIS